MADSLQPTLFDLPPPREPEPTVRPLERPVWTENKARLIERYLFYFVMITRHGTYIDGFAGQQSLDAQDGWAAKLVLESEPRWFRNFFLFDLDPEKARALVALKDSQPGVDARGRPIHRRIDVSCGDFNVLVDHMLKADCIGEREATFCLLDQRTFECEWATVEKLAQHKRSGRKIELFYFFPVKWLDRALAGLRNDEKLRRWWGRDDFMSVRRMSRSDRLDELILRFKEDLGYASAKPWPIWERSDGGAVMYYMIHATDHPDAPGLMSRAYRNAVMEPEGRDAQLAMDFGARTPRKRTRKPHAA